MEITDVFDAQRGVGDLVAPSAGAEDPEGAHRRISTEASRSRRRIARTGAFRNGAGLCACRRKSMCLVGLRPRASRSSRRFSHATLLPATAMRNGMNREDKRRTSVASLRNFFPHGRSYSRSSLTSKYGVSGHYIELGRVGCRETHRHIATRQALSR